MSVCELFLLFVLFSERTTVAVFDLHLFPASRVLQTLSDTNAEHHHRPKRQHPHRTTACVLMPRFTSQEMSTVTLSKLFFGFSLFATVLLSLTLKGVQKHACVCVCVRWRVFILCFFLEQTNRSQRKRAFVLVVCALVCIARWFVAS